MAKKRDARSENLTYSLSRWTDLPATKWGWFKERLRQGQMIGVDPKSGVPDLWSLRPEHTLGFVFWTRDSRNLIADKALVQEYQKVIHFTLTGWHEVEHKAPSLELGLDILARTCDAFGPENVVWRFSPVPHVLDVLDRWGTLAERMGKLGVRSAYAAFLQTNDLMAEGRTASERADLLQEMAKAAPKLDVRLCNEDDTLRDSARTWPNLGYGICEDGSRFTSASQVERCGCALAVDPFTINETCRFGCQYCYAADKSLAPKKRSTTKALTVVQ